MVRSGLAICLGLVLVWSVGCAPAPNGPAPAAHVTGTIKLDGQPIPTGEIHFGMLGVPPSVLEIKNGAFAGEAPIGKNQVEVFIYVEGPPSDKYPGVATKQNTTLDKYWGPSTTLEATVSAGVANEFKFDIYSK